ncbi:MAG: hypothetical protein ACI9XC_001468 [Gammaproteobacteria bacterium]|jgi:hypothetical protein
MKQTLHKQSGLTFIGLVLILGTLALVVVFALRLFPLYNEKFQIQAAMESVAAQPDSDKKSIGETRSAFLRAIAVSSVNTINSGNIKDYVDLVKPKKSGESPMLRLHYQSTNKLFADVQLLLTFDEQIPLGKSAGTGN